MKYQVDGWNNFCRVFELPTEFSSDFCFGGGVPTNFQMVDWFNPVPDIDRPAVSKKVWTEKVGGIKIKEVVHEELFNTLTVFLKKKSYVNMKPNRKYLVICDFGMCFTFSK